jgi:hypothetical protein
MAHVIGRQSRGNISQSECNALIRQHRDVVIKVVAKGQEGIQEFEINRLLNAEPLRSRPENHNIPVLDFLSYEDWKFIVMPPGMGAGMPMNNASEFFEFADQLLTVGFVTLDFTGTNSLTPSLGIDIPSPKSCRSSGT